MQQLSSQQTALIELLVSQLARIHGIRSIVLGGSHARGQARPESDIDLGLLYSDTYGTVGCLARVVNQLVLVLFALNRQYLLNDKSALAEIARFERCPDGFATRVQQVLAHPGASAAELAGAVAKVTTLFRETRELASSLYQSRVLP